MTIAAGLTLAAALGGCNNSQPGQSGTLSDILSGAGAPSRDLVCYHREAQCPVEAGAQAGEPCFCSTGWGYLKGKVRPKSDSGSLW
jgi:hypothetical protein